MRAGKFRKYHIWAASGLFGLAGIAHFLNTRAFVKIVPPYVPWPAAMVYLSGAAEIARAIGLLLRPFCRIAAYALIGLLVCVFPANVYMATHNIQVTSMLIPEWVLWARLPVQIALIWWMFLVGR